MNNQVFFWLITSLCFLMFEMGSPGLFFFISFALGALCAAGAVLAHWSLMTQLLSFLGGSFGAFVLLKRIIERSRALSKSKNNKSNMYAMQGKHGVVIQSISPTKVGQVKVGGQMWSASSVKDVAMSVGTRVEVINISGNRLVVQVFAGATERVEL